MSERGVRASAILLFILLLSGSYDSQRVLGKPLLLVPDALILSLAGLVFLGGWALLTPAGSSRRGVAPLAMSVSLVLAVWAASGLWGLRTDSHTENVSRLLVMVMIAVTTWLVCSVDSHAFWDTVVLSAFGAGMVYAVLGLAGGVGGDRLAVLGGGPNVYGRITAAGAIALLYLLAVNRLSLRWGAAIPLLFAVTILSGSRGAMLGLAAGLTVMFFALPRRRVRRLALVGVASAATAAVLVPELALGVAGAFGARVLGLTLQDLYLAGRDELWRAALDLLSQKGVVLGQGLDTYSALVGIYPHNLVLDLLLAVGALAILLLLVTLILWLRLVIPHANTPEVGTATAISVLYLIASMVSGGAYDSRFIWFLVVVSGCLAVDARSSDRNFTGSMRRRESLGEAGTPSSLAATSAGQN